jgi:hypothetical protein
VAISQISNVSIKTPTLGELRDAQTKGANGEFYITLPKFQRGIVWKSDQKKRLIDSIFNGYPVGSLLGFFTGEKDTSGQKPRDVIQLVDGLQRTTTIVEYLKEPLVLSPLGVLFSEEKISKIASLLGLSDKDEAILQISMALEAWATSTRVTKIPKGFESGKLITFLQTVPLLVESEQELLISDELNEFIGECLQDILDEIQAIERVQVPLISYMGPQEHVPEIFERINTQGIKLSKYEKFAAAWVNTRTHISNEEIRAAVEAKYQALIDAGYEVDDLSTGDQIPQDEYNLFEYLFGLGKVLSKRYEYLFPESSKPDESPAAGFVIATIAHGLKTSQMGSLANHLQGLNKKTKVIYLDKFESAVFAACDSVQKALEGYLRLNLNSQTSTGRFLPHSQNQIISFVVRTMLEQNDWSDWSPRKSTSIKKLTGSIASFYLLDILRGHWAGSGDSKLWDVCWDAESSTPAGPVQISDHYLNSPNMETWTNVLLSWHSEQLGKRQTERPNISGETKVFLKFVYAKLVPVHSDAQRQFDLEHLFPVDYLSRTIRNTPGQEGWPISAVGNLSILPAEINREKGSAMLGDFLRTSRGKQKESEEQLEIQRYVIYPELAELKRPDELTKEMYIDFCKRRFEALMSTVLQSLSVKQ